MSFSIFIKYDKRRYRLIPYLYSSYYQSYKTGSPISNYMLLIHLDKNPVSVTSGATLLKDWTFDAAKKSLEVTIAKKATEKISVEINK